jgi:hypothetical protein
MKNTAIIFLVVFLSFSAIAGDRLPSLLSNGVWELKSTSKGKPEQLNIETYTASFNSDGSWIFKSSLNGKFAGMTVEGAGSWSITGSTLNYTAGDNSGSSTIVIKDGILYLSPDPVVLFNGSEQIKTEYSNKLVSKS